MWAGSIAAMARLAAVPLVALLLAGCGTTELDLDKAERLVTETVTTQVGAEVESVECPADVTVEAGGTFECLVTATDGTKGDALLRQKDDEGNVNITAPFVRTRDLEDLIVEDLRQQVGGEVVIECPQIVVGSQGDTFECQASGDGDEATVLVTQKDDQGNVRYEIQQ